MNSEADTTAGGAEALDAREVDELIKALAGRVSALEAKTSDLEKELAELKQRSAEEIPEDVLIAISAAVSAYLGNRGKVRAVRFSRHRTWSQQGRQAAQYNALKQ